MNPEKTCHSKEADTQNYEGTSYYLENAFLLQKIQPGFVENNTCLFSLISSKMKWTWESVPEYTFENMKKIICSAPKLAQSDHKERQERYETIHDPFRWFTEGLGALLSREGGDKLLHPVFFVSHVLIKAE